MRFVDKLVKIKRKEWPKLRDLYSTHLSDSHIGYYTLDNYIRWLTQDSKVKNIAIYCLNGDFSDGTFVAVVSLFCENVQRLNSYRMLVQYYVGSLSRIHRHFK